ncbi:MAG: hypothetical protein RR338_01965 [Clostridia bacterium]
MARVLYNDCLAFDFVRKKDDFNLNKFLNKLIPNLVKQRKKRREIIHETLSDVLEYAVDLKSQERVSRYMDTIFDKIYFADEEYRMLSEQIWIRPNKENIIVFDEIVESELSICQMDISAYLRSLLNEYTKLPQHQRELLLFSEEIELVKLSIATDRLLNFKYDNQRHSMVAINFYSEFLYDQSNYIIGYDIKGQKIKSIKLYKIKDLYILAKKQHLDDSVYATFNKIAENFEFADSETFDVASEADTLSEANIISEAGAISEEL